ncbi:MAG: XdhC family protein [Acidobacteriota bacterium]
MNELLTKLTEALTNEQTVTLVTVIEVGVDVPATIKTGNKRLIGSAGDVTGSLGDVKLDTVVDHEIEHLVSQGSEDTITLWTKQFSSSASLTYPNVRLLIEILRPQPCLLICGAGHIARALTQLGLILGFRAIVIDDREEFANRSYFPDTRVELYAQPFTQALATIKVSPHMAVVIVTRGHHYDEDCLRLLLNTTTHYIGMIGSRRRVAVVMERLHKEGYLPAQLARVRAPIGLDIGARTPEEIALTILAEIVLVRNRGENIDDCRPLSRRRSSSHQTIADC